MMHGQKSIKLLKILSENTAVNDGPSVYLFMRHNGMPHP